MEKKQKINREFYRVWGRRASVIITVAFFLLLVVCTLFGEDIYTWITPMVSVQMPKTVMYEDGERYTRIPKGAVTAENTIYVVMSEKGFSRKIYRIREVEIEYIENATDSSELLTGTTLPQGRLVVTENPEKKGLKDGEQVLIQR